MNDHELPEVYRGGQPGLEVVEPKNFPEVVDYKAGPDDPFLPAPEAVTLKRRLRIRILIGVIVGAIIVIAAVLGGVFGSRAAASSNSGSPAATTTSTSPKATPTSIKSGSHIGVTGWRSGSVFYIWLFYQGQDSRIRLSRFESSTGKWSDPSSVVKAKLGSPIGASSFFVSAWAAGGGSYNQIELLYTNDTDWVREWNFNETNPIGADGSINFMQSGFGAGITRMSSYWPSTVFQDSLGRMIELLYKEGLGWHYYQTFLPINFTGLATVPNDPKLANWNLFFQRGDSSMVNFIGNETAGQKDYSQGPLNINIPPSAAIGAFAVPRAPDPSTSMNTYALSRTASGDFQMSWETDASGWQGPKTFSALSGVDNNTNIACLTPNAWPTTNLQPNYDMSRCYFQAGGFLKEVQFDGKDWRSLGNIPMS